jgi:signal peptidase I
MRVPIIIIVAATLALVLGVVVALRRRFLSVTVAGTSMLPTFDHGDRVLVQRTRADAIVAGQIVVLQRPGYRDGVGYTWDVPPASGAGSPWLVKRVVAAAGDPTPAGLPASIGLRPGDPVPSGHLVVLGDNGHISLDSRRIGLIPVGRVLGVAVIR